MTAPKVLCAIITYEGKDYVWDKFWSNAQRLDYPALDFIIVDNSRGRAYYQELKRRTKRLPNVTVLKAPRFQNSRVAQAVSLNLMREEFLKKDYDYLFLLESDLIPPVDTIKRLMAHQVSVVGSIYLIGYAHSKEQPPRPCLFNKRYSKTKPGEVETYNLPPEEGFGLFGQGLVPVHGCGFGTTLIKRWVVERFSFKYDLNPPVKHSDVLFYLELDRAFITAYVDTDVIVPHFNSDWNLVKDM